MALDLTDIFAEDEDSQIDIKPSFVPDYQVQMRGGYYNADTKSPATVDEWLFKFNDKDVADAFAEMFGGTVMEDTEGDFPLSLFSEAKKINGVVDPENINMEMKQWVNGKLVHHCTGAKFLSHPMNQDLVGTPCGCPPKLEDRKANAKNEMGPKPDITFEFDLYDPNGDSFRVQYLTHSWGLLKVLESLNGDIIVKGNGGPTLVSFGLKQLDFKTKAGKRVTPTVPEVRALKAWNDAIAE